jgi:hypothetical protein
MRYIEPRVLTTTSAVSSIKGSGKPEGGDPDNGIARSVTPAAYEADE